MAYKYLNDNGLKAYTKKVKAALKDLHTPIAISSENTTDSKAQNVRNIADFVAKAKAAGITDVNGMAVSCIIDNDYSGVGYFYYSTSICGIKTYEDISNPCTFAVVNGEYSENLIVIDGEAGYLNKSVLSPVLQEIDLTGTDAERKAKLTQFEADWKALTGKNDLSGARFVGLTDDYTGVFTYDSLRGSGYFAYAATGESGTGSLQLIQLDISTGSLTITPLFSHLEPVNIVTLDASSFHKMNLDNLNAYKSNLENLGVDTSKTFQVPFTADGNTRVGNLHYVGGLNKYLGVSYESRTGKVFHSEIDATGKYTETLLALDKDVQVVNTPVPLTATTSTNKTQLDSFLSKVPNAQVMHCTYKDVYAGTLHKINGSWYGVLVGESNTLAGQLSIKLQADGTIVEGTA